MKKLLHTISLMIGLLALQQGFAQTGRYFEEIFNTINVESNVVYGTNFHFTPPITVNPSNPQQGPLLMDIYTPAGDAETSRPLVIYLHDGSFLPQYFNGTTSGSRTDSQIVEICNRFARRGFVASSMSYRLGWDPLNASADVRRGTLLNAVYRAIHDAQTAVRFFKKSVAENGNPYGVDTSRIVLFGQGSGGFVTYAYNSLDRIEELQLEKFLDINGNMFINTALVGNIDGTGGFVNNYNHPGYSNNISMIVNLAGAIGDSSWLEAGDKPVVAFHTVDNAAVPFDDGIVIVPTTGEAVVSVSGSKYVVGESNALGIQDDLRLTPFSDPFSEAANQHLASNNPNLNLNPDDYEGLFPFLLPPSSGPAPENAPEIWWDSATVVNNVAAINAATGSSLNGTQIHLNSLLFHPEMSAERGRIYIDTIMGFSVPRIIRVLELPGFESLVHVENYNSPSVLVRIFPNPASQLFNIAASKGTIISYQVIDITGKTVRTQNGIKQNTVQVSTDGLASGMYLVRFETTEGTGTTNLILE